MLRVIMSKSWKQHLSKQQLITTYHASLKTSTYDEQDMWFNGIEV